MISLPRVRRRFPEAQEALGQQGMEYYIHCPKKHRKGPYNFKISINAESGAFVCHDCGWAGNAYQEWFDGVDEFFASLDVEPVNPLPSATRSHVRLANEWMDGIPSPGAVTLLSALPGDHPAFVYLRERGFDEEEIRGFGPERALYYCTKGEFTRGGGTNGGRLVFPVYMSGLLRGWQARMIERKVLGDGGEPLYKLVFDGSGWVRYDWNPKAGAGGRFQDEVRGIPKYNNCTKVMQRSQCLYGFDPAAAFESVVVVEGPLDQLAVGPEAVACMGGNGALSAGQAKLIAACWSSAVLLLDPGVDTESKGFRRTLDQLRAIPTTHLKLSNGRDPGSSPRSLIWQDITNHFENHDIRTDKNESLDHRG